MFTGPQRPAQGVPQSLFWAALSSGLSDFPYFSHPSEPLYLSTPDLGGSRTTAQFSFFSQESRLAKNEAARMAALVEVEKGCNLELSEKLKDAAKDREDAPGDQVKPDQYSEALAQRDRWVSSGGLFSLAAFPVFPRRTHHSYVAPPLSTDSGLLALSKMPCPSGPDFLKLDSSVASSRKGP